jgi:sigma-B regulation protein RsbU (phosphoserine phosphatase)
VKTAWVFRPCEELAGDSLNVFRLDEDHIGLYVLDVSGHGAAAALLAVALHGLLSPALTAASLLKRSRPGNRGYSLASPAHVAEKLNRTIRPHLPQGQYLTLLYGILNVRTREFRFASAGHWGPIVVSARGTSDLIHARGFPVGVMEDATYEEHAVQLQAGDRLYLYSDGIPEATNACGEQFDYLRIIRSLERHRGRPLGDGLSRLVRHVQRWHRGSRLEDDVSVLALELEERRPTRPPDSR